MMSKRELGAPDESAPSGVQPSASDDLVETPMRSGLIWDDEARGLCVRVYPGGSQSFIFVYRINDRQRFIRIGRSPRWSFEVARIRANSARSSSKVGTLRATSAKTARLGQSKTLCDTSPTS